MTVKQKRKPAGEMNGKPEPPIGLVAEVEHFIRRWVVMTDAQLHVTALWVLHTQVAEHFEQTPYLSVTSPEKQCGKSRLLEVIQLLVWNPWYAIVPSEAVVYRKVSNDKPTLLLDEVDTIFNLRQGDKYEGLRALLNAGHRRGAKVPRCVGTSQEIVEFSTFCPKVLAGIGALPDTVADRSVPIRLQRKTRDEKVEPFKLRDASAEAASLVERIEAWSQDHGEALGEARPAMPEQLSDREQEGCEPLVAIADSFGCGEQARAALVELLSGERLDNQETIRLELLRDLKVIFDRHKGARAAFTTSLLTELWQLPESRWDNYYGRGQMTDRDLANLLHHYGVRSTTVRTRGVANPAKGYKRGDLQAVWDRYL